MKIGEFMTTRIEYVDDDMTVHDAMKILVDRRKRSLVLVNRSKKKDYAVVTARDVVSKVLAKGLDPKSLKISEIATGPLICLPPDTEFEEVALIMEKKKIARVFVCELGKIVGFVSLLDVMSAELIMRARGRKDFDQPLTEENRSNFSDSWRQILRFNPLKQVSDP
jgi:signal-transduction protein with cAMP-binding, CBS, and nucleotidyltransferase domain